MRGAKASTSASRSQPRRSVTDSTRLADPEFMAAGNDLHNLLPAGGEVNGDPLYHPYGGQDVNAWLVHEGYRGVSAPGTASLTSGEEDDAE